MGRVLVVGCGDFGRDVLTWALGDPHFLGSDSVAMLDDDSSALARHPKLQAIYAGGIQDYAPLPGDRLLMGIADPATKSALHEWACHKNVTFSTFIHSSVIAASDAIVGVGTVICPNAVVSTSAVLQPLVTVGIASIVNHDVVVGKYSSIMNQADITGWVSLGEQVFVGSHASILPRVHVGDHAVVGAGSVVLADVPESQTVVGVPARRLPAVD